MLVKLLILVGLAALLVGCTVQPAPIMQAEVELRVENDLRLLKVTENPVAGPISIHEAMARALAYNLDLNLERYKSNLIETQFELSRFDQLPELVADHISDGRVIFLAVQAGRYSLVRNRWNHRLLQTDTLNGMTLG